MQITFNTPQEETDWQDFCERLCECLADMASMTVDEEPIKLLREMQERGMTFE